MIKIFDSNFTLFDKFKDFCKIDSFGTRIYSHFLCYGYEYNFVDFWVQISDDNLITAAFCRLDGDLVVCACKEADFEEITTFLNFTDKLTVTFDCKFVELIKIDCSSISYGDILMYEKSKKDCEKYTASTPDIKEYHNLLLMCKSDDFFVPEYLNFLSDVSRRVQKEICDICGVYCDDKLVSCAMTVSYTDFSVILGAVATDPRYRKRGFAGFVVSTLAEKYKFLDSVYIYTTIERNTRFYESLGFCVCDRWVKYTYGG